MLNEGKTSYTGARPIVPLPSRPTRKSLRRLEKEIEQKVAANEAVMARSLINSENYPSR